MDRNSLDTTSAGASDKAADPCFVDKSGYLSPAIADLEAERLWPRVWQVACRLEEIPDIGNFVTYDIVDDSIVVVRTGEATIKAFHNVCQHRGRRLMEGCGRATQFMCRFHGWRWNLEGKNTDVPDRADWGDTLRTEEIGLKPVLVDTWGGFVFINMDLEAEPLLAFMAPIEEHCGRFEFEKLRYRWYKTFRFPSNWKVAVEAFNEAYHVQGTHRQFLEFLEDYSTSKTFGVHSAFWYPALKAGESRYRPSSRLGKTPQPDRRRYMLAFYKEIHEELAAQVTPRAYEAVSARLLAEVSADADEKTVLQTVRRIVREAAAADGAGWPDVTDEYVSKSLQDWHVFPNFIYLHSMVDGVIAYRARPDGRNPDSCIFDVWSLVRYAPGAEPPLKREFYEDWPKAGVGRILAQDFGNMAEVQKGMKSRGFGGSRTNPVQEQAVSSFHRNVGSYLATK